MATESSNKSIDVQKLLSGAAKIEIKLINAGVEAMQVSINQAARFSSLAADTLQALQDDKATLADTARKLTEFGRQNVQAYAALSQKLGASYYDELDKLADSAFRKNDAPSPAPGPVSQPVGKKPPRRGRKGGRG